MRRIFAGVVAVVLGLALVVVPGVKSAQAATVPGVGSIVIDGMVEALSGRSGASEVGTRKFLTGMQNGTTTINSTRVSLADVYAGKYGKLTTLYSHCTSYAIMIATWVSDTGLPCPGYIEKNGKFVKGTKLFQNMYTGYTKAKLKAQGSNGSATKLAYTKDMVLRGVDSSSSSAELVRQQRVVMARSTGSTEIVEAVVEAVEDETGMSKAEARKSVKSGGGLGTKLKSAMKWGWKSTVGLANVAGYAMMGEQIGGWLGGGLADWLIGDSDGVVCAAANDVGGLAGRTLERWGRADCSAFENALAQANQNTDITSLFKLPVTACLDGTTTACITVNSIRKGTDAKGYPYAAADVSFTGVSEVDAAYLKDRFGFSSFGSVRVAVGSQTFFDTAKSGKLGYGNNLSRIDPEGYQVSDFPRDDAVSMISAPSYQLGTGSGGQDSDFLAFVGAKYAGYNVNSAWLDRGISDLQIRFLGVDGKVQGRSSWIYKDVSGKSGREFYAPYADYSSQSSVIEAQDQNPQRQWQSCMTYSDGTEVCSMSDPWTESDGEIPMPAPASDSEEDKTPASAAVYEVTDGKRPATPSYSAEVDPGIAQDDQKYPGCRDGSCTLDLIKNDTNKSCFDSGTDCLAWAEDPDKETDYTCTYGSDATGWTNLDISECTVYKDSFKRESAISGETLVDPETGESLGQTDQPAASGDVDTASCWASMWSWNPLDWVLTPVKCALQWAFLPSDQQIASLQDGVDVSATRVQAVGRIRDAVAVMSEPWPASEGCEGILVPFSRASGIINGAQDFYIAQSCDGPLKWFRETVYYMFLAFMTIVVVRNIIRIAGSQLGFDELPVDTMKDD